MERETRFDNSYEKLTTDYVPTYNYRRTIWFEIKNPQDGYHDFNGFELSPKTGIVSAETEYFEYIHITINGDFNVYYSNLNNFDKYYVKMNDGEYEYVYVGISIAPHRLSPDGTSLAYDRNWYVTQPFQATTSMAKIYLPKCEGRRRRGKRCVLARAILMPNTVPSNSTTPSDYYQLYWNCVVTGLNLTYIVNNLYVRFAKHWAAYNSNPCSYATTINGKNYFFWFRGSVGEQWETSFASGVTSFEDIETEMTSTYQNNGIYYYNCTDTTIQGPPNQPWVGLPYQPAEAEYVVCGLTVNANYRLILFGEYLSEFIPTTGAIYNDKIIFLHVGPGESPLPIQTDHPEKYLHVDFYDYPPSP